MKQLKYFTNLCLAFTLHLMFVLVRMKKQQQLTIHTIGINMCQIKCMEYGFCKSIAYKGNKLTCHLSSQVRKSEKRNGFTVIRVGYQVRNGTCSLKAGDPTMICLKTRSGKYAWIQENVSNATEGVTPADIKSTCLGIATSARKGSDDSCKTGKFLCGSKSKPQCCHSWKWSRGGGKCFKSTWKITDQPHLNLKEEFRLSMTAISGRGRQKVFLDFRDDSSLLFGFDISMRRSILALAYNNHIQKGLRKPTSFPFRKNKKYIIDIIKKNDAYKVFINGKPYVQTSYTFPWTGPYMIRVEKMHRNVNPLEVKIRNYAPGACC